jgi:hypothetical protein
LEKILPFIHPSSKANILLQTMSKSSTLNSKMDFSDSALHRPPLTMSDRVSDFVKSPAILGATAAVFFGGLYMGTRRGHSGKSLGMRVMEARVKIQATIVGSIVGGSAVGLLAQQYYGPAATQQNRLNIAPSTELSANDAKE